MLRPLILGLITTVGLSGCLRETPGIYLPVGHPADPGTRAGAPIPITRALAPEFPDVQPDLRELKPEKKMTPANDHSGHQMNKQ